MTPGVSEQLLEEAMKALKTSVDLKRQMLGLFEDVREWRRVHAEHAGHAPLAELDTILDQVFTHEV